MKKFLLIIFILFLFLFCPRILRAADDYYSTLRKRMVEQQIKMRGIKDERVLAVMLKVERHRFVPFYLREFAYDDRPLPIGEEQTISQPYMVALMTEVLTLKPQDKVLEIGTGSGYQAAILAEITNQVYTIEILPKLAEKAQELLTKLGYKNIQVKCGDGYLGWPEFAPFDAIIVTCAPEDIPQSLIEQLAEGGRMVIPVGRENSVQELILVKKKQGRLEKSAITGCIFVPMIKGDKK
jgi:protein-L-isoaspartate(D-aspartate) O-methyltransferase